MKARKTQVQGDKKLLYTQNTRVLPRAHSDWLYQHSQNHSIKHKHLLRTLSKPCKRAKAIEHEDNEKTKQDREQNTECWNARNWTARLCAKHTFLSHQAQKQSAAGSAPTICLFLGITQLNHVHADGLSAASASRGKPEMLGSAEPTSAA